MALQNLHQQESGGKCIVGSPVLIRLLYHHAIAVLVES